MFLLPRAGLWVGGGRADVRRSCVVVVVVCVAAEAEDARALSFG